MGLAEIKAGLIKKGYSTVSLDKKTIKDEPKPKKAPKKEIPLPEPKKNEPEVETEHQCNECGETPEDCKCDDCDCEK